MKRTILALAGLLAYIGLPPVVRAAEVYEANVEGVEVAEAPFRIEVLGSQWRQQDDGSFALVLEYAVTNLGDDPLASLGWVLGVETGNGAPKSYLSEARSFDLEPGETSSSVLQVSEKSLGGFDASDRIRFSGTASSTQRCAGGEVDCSQIQFACQMSCNNPLGTNRGVKRFRCDTCTWVYDNQRQCWKKQCNFECECGDQLWPDQMPALDEFTDWNPILEGGPGDPWPWQ
ncbi:MAG: hypothetical protein KDD47_21340 [Acidobacteria bacterium]|nr:hypothetical protein [Acidobacteriota bacterium]